MLALQVEKFGEALVRSPLASLAAILVVALACFLPGFTSTATLDGDEPGYAVEFADPGIHELNRLAGEPEEDAPAFAVEPIHVQADGGLRHERHG